MKDYITRMKLHLSVKITADYVKINVQCLSRKNKSFQNLLILLYNQWFHNFH